MPEFRETNDPISRKHPDKCQEARMEKHFHRILPATASGLTSRTAVNWHLKVKGIGYRVKLLHVGLKNHAKIMHHS